MTFFIGFIFAGSVDLIAYKNGVLEDSLDIEYSIMFWLLVIATLIASIFISNPADIILPVLGSIAETVVVKEIILNKLNR